MLPDFDVRDAACSSTLGEMAKLLKELVERTGGKHAQYMRQVYFPGISCPDAMAADFVAHAEGDSARDLKKYLRNFFKQAQPHKYG